MSAVVTAPVRSHDIELPSLATGHEVVSDEPGEIHTAEGEQLPSRPLANDSDLQAAIICLACFTVVFIACGTLFAFGVYQELYDRLAKEPHTPFTGASPASIDLIGTLSVAFMTIGAPFTTAWTKRFSPRIVITSGGLLFGVACFGASFCTQLWQFEITQGLLLGLGTCLAYMPAVTLAPTWYGPRRGFAMGIILSGTGIGGLVWAPAIRALIDRFGFRNTLRISGAISGSGIIAAAALLDWDSATKARILVEQTRRVPGSWHRGLWNIPLIDWRIARTKTFAVQLLATSLQSAAYYTPVFFFSTYARTLGYSQTAGANFIAINNACNAIGKIVVGIIADRVGQLNMLLITTILSALASFGFWLPSSLSHSMAASRGLFITYSVTYGLFASPYVSLLPATLVELFGPANFAGVNGFLYMVRGLATLVGTPSAGALIRNSLAQLLPVSYWRTSLMVGVLLASASAAVLWVRIESKLAGRSSRV